jgi:hypothetical protein
MRDEFYKVTGNVRYGNLGAKQAAQFRNQIAMNTEGKSICLLRGHSSSYLTTGR